MDTVLVTEGDFQTYAQAYALFEMVKGLRECNNIFVAMKDASSDGMGYRGGGIIGGMIARAVDKKDAFSNLAYDGLLINDTEAGIGVIPIVYKKITLTFDPSKMTAKPNRYFFIPKEEIKQVKIKNVLLNSKRKRFVVKFENNKRVILLLSTKDKAISYQEQEMERLLAKYEGNR